MKAKTIIPILFMSLSYPLSGNAQNSVAFIHVADSGNTIFNSSRCSHELLNDSSKATPIFTHRYSVGSEYVSYLNKKLGIWYVLANSRWAVYTQDKSAFPTNTAFNVLAPGIDMMSLVHKSDNSNITGDYTVIDNLALNNNPNAVFLVNDLYKGSYNLKITGVYYHQGSQRWRIFNMDGSLMASNLYFNIVVAVNGQPYGAAFHSSTALNIKDNRTALDIPSINNNPNAVVFVSQVWPQSGAKNNNNVGVYYSSGKWYVYNETNGGSPVGFEMPEKAGFNIVYFLNKPTNIAEQTHTSQKMNVFPNPVQNGEKLYLTLEEALGSQISISLNTIEGKCVYSSHINDYLAGSTYTLNISDFAPGIYTLKIECEGKLGIQKVMIK
jgi:Secretion system C-terminal sorting domain